VVASGRVVTVFGGLAVVLVAGVGAAVAIRAGGALPAGGSCAPEQVVPIQGGDHLIGDQDPPVPYLSTPPTSGWHASGTFQIEVQGPEDPLSEPQQVSVLEAGGVVVTYRGLAEADRAALEDLVRDRSPGRAAVTPYDALEPGQTAMTAWGVVQRCDGLDADAVAGFIARHAAPRPRTPGGH
jgi:hypothetical protein